MEECRTLFVVLSRIIAPAFAETFVPVIETMRAVMDPMVLFEEAEDTLVSMQELSQIQWPDDKRPGD